MIIHCTDAFFVPHFAQRQEGVGALYQGLGTSILGIVPYAGIDLAVNSLLKEAAASYYEVM
jgi:hypothetical protein